MFACFSSLALVGKKKHSKRFSKAAEGSKKRRSRRRHRVKPVDFVSNSNDLETINETISKSFPSVEKPSHTIPNAPMDDAESIRDVSYEGDDEQQSETIQSLKGDCSAAPEGELVIHDGSSDGFNGSVLDKQSETDNGIAREATAASNSCMDRINAWVDRLEDCSFSHVDAEDYCDKIQDESDVGDESSPKNCVVTSRNQAEEGVGGEAKNIIQSLNSFSTNAYISSIGLKLIPSMAAFVCLRSVNLSGNCIVEITPGSLPKSLHTLDLSHNKISTVEGLRGLEKLRILNLSYNRISRIGHGLSSCTLIKELYLAGNKISNVEGLHRILKMKVLDLSFNKITTAKGLGQLVSNYNSLLALNLTGNPVQTNIGNDQLQNEVQGLLPHLSYLNKLPIKPLKIREVATKCVAKAAVGDAARRSPQRKMTRRLSGIGSSASSTIKTGGNLREASPKATPFRAIKRRSKSELSTPASINYSRRSYSMVPAV
ncbi:hypothetical protein KSP39_PZI003461 [Platanthera zijinensis]|uniref:Leucine-rich repeat family protein n=1 Tax=Platanthera zijinensis TaxID=2320716 RepID=A0AAP0GDA9_9ASPA